MQGAQQFQQSASNKLNNPQGGGGFGHGGGGGGGDMLDKATNFVENKAGHPHVS